MKTADNIVNWIKEASEKESQIRKFLEDRRILTVPDWVQHYTLRAMPEYLRALQGFGEMDDFTSPSRLNENCIRYVTRAFRKARLLLAGNGGKTHGRLLFTKEFRDIIFSFVLSWKQRGPDPAALLRLRRERRNRLYAEEMMLQAGLFDNSPHTREIIYNFMRLRAAYAWRST